MPPRTILPIQKSGMASHAVIPNYHCPRRPLHSRLEILALGDVIVQEVEKVVALFFLKPDNAAGELRVDIKSLFACCGMSPDERVDRGHWCTADDAASQLAGLGLFNPWWC